MKIDKKVQNNIDMCLNTITVHNQKQNTDEVIVINNNKQKKEE